MLKLNTKWAKMLNILLLTKIIPLKSSQIEKKSNLRCTNDSL